jgi:aminoglycoside phosphotransferase (APT) family kinase protein
MRDTPGVAEDLVHAVLAPPDLSRFRELTGIGDADLGVSFEGWAKLALLTEDRVFLFPRRGHDAQLLHGARVCDVLSRLGVRYAPRVLGRWPDGALTAGPFVAFERRSGLGWDRVEDRVGVDEVEQMLNSLGRAIATWHRIAVSDLPSDLQHMARFEPKQPWLRGFLDPARVDRCVDEAVALLHPRTSWSSIWLATLRAVSSMTPVLVHGDVCENQLLVDKQARVGTVLDWDTAGIGHPLHDFDFGEWGFGIFTWQDQFARLRRSMWEGYRAGRPGADLPDVSAVHLLFTLSDLAYVEQQNRQGPIDEWGTTRLANCRAAIAAATDAAASG